MRVTETFPTQTTVVSQQRRTKGLTTVLAGIGFLPDGTRLRNRHKRPGATEFVIIVTIVVILCFTVFFYKQIIELLLLILKPDALFVRGQVRSPFPYHLSFHPR